MMVSRVTHNVEAGFKYWAFMVYDGGHGLFGSNAHLESWVMYVHDIWDPALETREDSSKNKSRSYCDFSKTYAL